MSGNAAEFTILYAAGSFTNASGFFYVARYGRINGVENLIAVGDVIIYPNPSFEKVTVETIGMPSTGLLSILNLIGQELIRQQVSASKTVVDIKSLPNGDYFIKVTNERTVQVGKLIKE